MLKELKSRGREVVTKRLELEPVRVVLTQGKVEGAENMLKRKARQISLNMMDALQMQTDSEKAASVVFDFGCELHGSLRLNIFAGAREGAKLRFRFGESVSEAMSEIGGKTNATNDHARRDFTAEVGFCSMNAIGETGFRFVRIDLLTEGTLLVKSVTAQLIYQDVPYRGTFTSSDELLNRIWATGAYTMHLNMQEYIWDGVKRDRLVWIADMHPETLTVRTVFGDNPSVKKSLDFVREDTPLPGWMNHIASYTMWYVIILYDWYFYTGDLEWLRSQKSYLTGVARQLMGLIGDDGHYLLDQREYFLDWPSCEDPDATDAGVKAIHYQAIQRLIDIFTALKDSGDEDLITSLRNEQQIIKGTARNLHNSKPAAALLGLFGLEDCSKMSEDILLQRETKGMSTYMAYYILSALSAAGHTKEALELTKRYFGGMLSLGATTFWEDFDLDWTKNASPIDRFPREGEIDVHGLYGGYCYKGFRHSLCHGWASGVTAWLTERVLGVTILEPGCTKLLVQPDLGNLDRAEGVFPTPLGDVRITVSKNNAGDTVCKTDAPDGIEIVRQ